MTQNYLEMRLGCYEIPVADDLPYNLNAGEMNPNILTYFSIEVKKHGLPLSIWEPFAGTSCMGSCEKSLIQDLAEEYELFLISYGLEPSDSRIIIADSTFTGPKDIIGGMIFHPPYFGSVPMSKDVHDLSLIHEKSDYIKELGMVVDNAIPFMVNGGLVCAVGRDYRSGGKRHRMDLILLELFEGKGFVLKNVWKSTPDIVMIFSNENKTEII